MEKDETLNLIKQAWIDNQEFPSLFFENAIGILQYFAVKKNIEFDGFFRTKWEIEADHPMTFDEAYFEDENRSELYVYLSAEADSEIYDCLKYAYDLVHDEKMSNNVLHKEIYLLKEQGISF